MPFPRDTAATLQLPLRIEKSAQTQLEPMLESMAVAETEHSASALAKEVPVRIVQSEPKRKAEMAALAAVGGAVQVCEGTAQHLWTASDEMLWSSRMLASSDEDEYESQNVLGQ